MKRRYLATALTGLATLAAATLIGPQNASAAVSSLTVYIGAKVDQPGLDPAVAANAAGLGTVTISPAQSTTTITVQKRPAGSTDAWTTHTTGTTGDPGGMKFRAWMSDEYRACAGGVCSPVKRYPYTLIFTDEFDTYIPGATWSDGTPVWRSQVVQENSAWICGPTSPDWCATKRTPWDHRMQGGTPGYTYAHTGTDMCRVSAGTARINVDLETDPSSPFKYKECHVGTMNYFDRAPRQGSSLWFAFRAKMQGEYGHHGGLWAQGRYCYGGNEMDINEYYGRPRDANGNLVSDYTTYDVTTHGEAQPVSPDSCGDLITDVNDHVTVNDNCCGSAAWWNDTSQRWWNSYHVFSVRWIPTVPGTQTGSLQYYVDDKKVRTVTGDWVADTNHPAFLVLSMLTRDWEVNEGRTKYTDTQLPATMHVDWVQAWEQTG